MSNYSHATLELEVKNTAWTKIFGYVRKGSTVLDVGCSDGVLGHELKQRKGCTVYGIELDTQDAAAARKVLDGVFEDNIETSKLPAKLATLRFDAIILADVIEHFVHPIKALKTLLSLLRPTGRVIFSVPNMAHISVRLQLLGGSFRYNETGLLDKTHLHFYDFAELKRVLAAAGLKIASIDANTLAYPPSFLHDKLDALGLADAGFVTRITKDKNAQSFQFVGYCVPFKVGERAPDTRLATTTPEHELTEYIESLRKKSDASDEAERKQAEQIAELQKEKETLRTQVAAAQSKNKALAEEIAALQARVAEVTSSRLWRVGNRAHNITKRLQKRKKL